MNRYSLFCTEEQTKKALELGASIEKERIGKCITENIPHLTTNNEENEYDYLIPIAEQMIGWLETHGFWYINITYYVVGDYWCYHGVTNGGHDSIGYNTDHYNSRKEATLAAIDVALEYLANKK